MKIGQRTNTIDLHVAARLRAARLAAGISQEKAAAHLDLTFQQLQKYETGSNRISAGKLARLAQIYGRPVAWFFDGAPIEGAAIEGRELQPDHAAQMLASRHGARMIFAFLAIESPLVRGTLVDVAEAIASSQPATQRVQAAE
jgi:transcriptional regulator with XRE-family HTH domain